MLCAAPPVDDRARSALAPLGTLLPVALAAPAATSLAGSCSADDMRRLVISAIVLVAMLIVTDRLSATAAQRDVASRIQAAEDLRTRPDVHIGGFPFLTQLVAGEYDDVDVTLHDLRAGPLPIDRLTAHLAGARVSLGEVLRQRVGAIPTDRASADLLLRYEDLNRFVATQHVRLSQGRGGRLHVAATAEVAGASVSAGDVPVVVSGSVLTIDVAGGVQLRIPLPGLPFHLHLDTAKATHDGVLVQGSADGLVLRP